MGPQEYYNLAKVVQETEYNPDKTLFLMDESDPGSPFLKIPLGEDKKLDGYLIIHPEGWFIDKED